MENNNLLDPNIYFKVRISLYNIVYTEERRIKSMDFYKLFLREIKHFLNEMGFVAKTIDKQFVFLKGNFEQFLLKEDELIGFVKRNTIHQLEALKEKTNYETFEIESLEELYETRNYTFLEYFNTLQEKHLELYKHVEPKGVYNNNPFALFPDFNFHSPDLPNLYMKLFQEEIDYIKKIKLKK